MPECLMFFISIRKSLLYTMKIYGAIIASLTIPTHAAADSTAIIGGIDLTGTGPAYAALDLLFRRYHSSCITRRCGDGRNHH